MSQLKPLLKAYSGIFFLPSVKVGIALLLLTLVDPNIGLSGLIGVLSAYLFAHFLGFSKTFLSLDYYIYNPLLVGLGIGFLFKLSPLTVALEVVSSILTFLLTLTLSNIFGYYLRLPILSLPFVIVGTIVYLASYKYSNLFVYYLYPHAGRFISEEIPRWIEGFLRSLGEIIFYPDSLVGLVIFLILLRFSPILAFLSALGYYGGTLFEAVLNGDFYTSFGSLSAFNYILVALSLGGVFLIPHPRSYLLALFGVLVAVPIVQAVEIFFQNYGIPVFALPFNAVVLLFIYSLGILGYRYLTFHYLGTPEKTLDYFIAYQNRFPSIGREIGLPFSGRWTVWQSFDGEWTHKGPWKYALDFVITDEEGKTFKGNGYYLSDYYAYRKPVLSPVSGTVVEVVDGYPDNPPGEADKENNWGNYVLIQDWRGFYVLICHFAQNTIKVKKGDRVEKGSLLGLCGNSGYSPQPHIHIHVQLIPKVGSPTVPFAVESYVNSEGRFFDLAIPQKGEKIEAFYPDKVLYSKFNLLIDEEYRFIFSKNGREREVALKVQMAPDGTFYLTDGVSKLYFGQRGGIFYCYNLEGDSEVLKVLFTALSKIPLNLNGVIKWQDSLPLGVLAKLRFKNLIYFLSSFYHRLLKVESNFANEDNFRYRVESKYLGKKFLCEVKISQRDKFIEEVFLKTEGTVFILKRA